MTKYRTFYIAAAAAVAVAAAAGTTLAGELDAAFAPQDTSGIVELRTLDVPVIRVAAIAPLLAPQPAAQVQPEQPAPTPEPGFWQRLRTLLPF